MRASADVGGSGVFTIRNGGDGQPLNANWPIPNLITATRLLTSRAHVRRVAPITVTVTLKTCQGEMRKNSQYGGSEMVRQVLKFEGLMITAVCEYPRRMMTDQRP